MSNKQWQLSNRPEGAVSYDNFQLAETEIPAPEDGEILVRTLYLSVAPVMRMYMTTGAAGIPKLDIGDCMPGRGVGYVMKSNHPEYGIGDVVHGSIGWQEYALLKPTAETLIFKHNHHDIPVSTAIGCMGMTGYTAYFGLMDVGELKPGQTVVISAAAGGVGCNVGQIAKALGCRTIGIAGGPEKCQMIVDRCGCDEAVDYKAGDVEGQLRNLLGDAGANVVFDNVGGAVLDAMMANLAHRARVISCGRISDYLREDDPYRLRNYGAIGKMKARFEGFFIYDYKDRFPEADAAMARWFREGKLKPVEDMLEGLDRMPEALIRLYESQNRGKQLVNISKVPSGWC